MPIIRRVIQVVAVLGTLFVGILAVVLIVSQTPWFRDWLRGYIVRQANDYLEGELTIGRLSGNLFFGIDLTDVGLDLAGDRIVSVSSVKVQYSVFEIISHGAVVDEIRLVEPRLHLERDGNGWNVGRLVTAREREADREGPGRTISLKSIQIVDGALAIDDGVGTNGYRLPDRVDDLDVEASFEYEPVHYTVALSHLSFRTTGPPLAVENISGVVSVRDDNVYLDEVTVGLDETSLTLDGVIEAYAQTPVLRLRSAGKVSLPEIGRFVPALAEYDLHPAFDVRAEGPIEQLALGLDVQSEAGHVKGDVTADLRAPDYGMRGEVNLQRLDLAPILRDPAQRSDITGQARVNLRIADRPDAPVLDRLSGTFAFTGPRVLAAGYEASHVQASGRFDGRRLELDARAAAYGGTATAQGFIALPAGTRPLAFDLRGRADDLDLRDLRTVTGVPALETDLSVAGYHVQGNGAVITASATLNESMVEGATVAAGTVGEFRSERGEIAYAAQGQIANLDLARIGRALKIEALAQPEYRSRITGPFDVKGSGTALDELTLDARGTLIDSELLGGRLPEMAYTAHIAEGALRARADGRFEGFDPGRLTNRPEVAGRVTGTVDAEVVLADLDGPFTPETFEFDGTVMLEPSTVGEVTIDSAEVQARYAAEVADITRVTVTSPDLTVKASGRLALDRAGASDLEYYVQVVDLAEVGRLAGQDALSGSAIVQGRATGNRSELRLEGTLDSSNLTYDPVNALDLTSRYTITLPDLQFADARIQATTEATFVQVSGAEFNQLFAETTYQAQRLEFAAQVRHEPRELEAGGTLILHPDHQEIHLPSLAMRTEGIEWRLAPDTEATIQYGRGRVEIEGLHLVSGAQSLEVSGLLALTADEPAGTLEVQARQVDLQQIETLLLQDRGFGGTLSADATITGSTDAPRVEATVEVSNGAFRDYRYESLTADVNYTGRHLELDARLQQSAAEAISAKGTVPMTLFEPGVSEHVLPADEDRIDLHVESTDLGLGLVQGFTDQITNVAGTLRANIQVTGSGRDPHFEGHVEIRNGAFAVPATGVAYSGLDTRIQLDPDRVRLSEFSILDEHGRALTVSGELAVHAREVGAVDVTIRSRNFEILDNQLGDIGVDTDLRITGELRRPRITGDVRLDTARLELHRLMEAFYDPYAVEALPAVVTAEGRIIDPRQPDPPREPTLIPEQPVVTPEVKEPAEPAATPGMLDPVALDVRLRIPDNLLLRGRDLRPGGPTGAAIGDVNLTVGGDLRIRKEPGEPVTIAGTVTTVRGTYDFQGRRFTIPRGGQLRFAGLPEINPELDVTAVRQIPRTRVEARVHITGTAQDPEIELSSDPPLDESDVLALIIFNRPVNELGTGERASLAATATGIATGFLAAPLGESIARALDLDVFEITTTDELGELGAGLLVGQQFGDRAWVQLRQRFGDRAATEFLLEYQLADFLRVQATAAPESATGTDRLGERRIERAGLDLFFFFSY